MSDWLPWTFHVRRLSLEIPPYDRYPSPVDLLFLIQSVGRIGSAVDTKPKARVPNMENSGTVNLNVILTASSYWFDIQIKDTGFEFIVIRSQLCHVHLLKHTQKFDRFQYGNFEVDPAFP